MRSNQGPVAAPGCKRVMATAVLLCAPLTAWTQATPPPAEAAATPAPKVEISPVKFTFGGWIKLDAVASRFSDGDVNVLTGARDYYSPGAIPIAATTALKDEHTYLQAHAKDTRVWAKGESLIAGHAVTGYLELDFRTNPGGYNTRTTNAYNPGLRRAYFTYDRWLLGQDFTTFRNSEASPESVDALGPTDGLILNRYPQVRYSTDRWQIALEEPETALIANRGATEHSATGDSIVPDLVVKYLYKPGFGSFSVAGLLRQLKADNHVLPPVNAKGSDTGYALSVAGKVPLMGKDDLRFAASGGVGVGRYLGSNTVDDASVNLVGEIDAIPVANGFIAYRHPWSDKLRSSFTVSGLVADNDGVQTGGNATQSVLTYRANLLYSPIPPIHFGVEALFGERKNERGDKGSLSRLQFAAKYVFG
ncbi:MAG: DcaP family trimeric outer membrane transporter [Stagnimonas sp.]|nr:DcaP family trimeric outer membrane transporter [Stagnimonas sp.]